MEETSLLGLAPIIKTLLVKIFRIPRDLPVCNARDSWGTRLHCKPSVSHTSFAGWNSEYHPDSVTEELGHNSLIH